jgi:ABC-type Mn2+/Zn2+ transport system permease subunit
MNIIELMTEPFQYEFMIRAFLGLSLLAVLSGFVGTFITLKGLAIFGDAIAHACFGGLVLALLLGFPLQIGALVVGFGTVVILTVLERKTDLKSDTSLAILFTGTFALGILGLSLRPTFAGDLNSFLLGSVLAIGMAELYWIIAAVVLTLTAMHLAFPRLLFLAFDPTGAEAAGLKVTLLQLLLFTMIALTVVVSIQAVGAILVVAMLVTPAATASLLTNKIKSVIGLAVLIGLVSGWMGLYISYYFSTPTGATIVSLLTLFFLLGVLYNRIRKLIYIKSKDCCSH